MELSPIDVALINDVQQQFPSVQPDNLVVAESLMPSSAYEGNAAMRLYSGRSWREMVDKLPRAIDEETYSSRHFMTAASYAYFFPAYLELSLRGDMSWADALCFDLDFGHGPYDAPVALANLAEQLRTYSDDQLLVIRDVLRCLQKKYELEGETQNDAERLLLNYWSSIVDFKEALRSILEAKLALVAYMR